MHRISNKIGLLFVVLAAGIVNNNLFAQACCTGSTPITGAYRIASTAANKWNLSLIGDYNYIGDLYAFDTKLDNESLSRNTITLLLQTDYGLTERLSASVVIPYISKSEQINMRGTTEKVSTNSIGDISIIFRYELIKKHELFNLLIGSGIKFPTGPTQLKDSDSQIILIPSLQPGTGSYDYLFLSQFQFSMPFRKSLGFIQAFSYQLTGTSDRFATFSSYKFGNEFQTFSTFSDQFVWFNKIFSPSVSLKMSNRQGNKFDDFEDANTGGTWWYISPGITFQLNPDMGFLIQADIPVQRKVNGFQLIPTYIIRGGVYITL